MQGLGQASGFALISFITQLVKIRQECGKSQKRCSSLPCCSHKLNIHKIREGVPLQSLAGDQKVSQSGLTPPTLEHPVFVTAWWFKPAAPLICPMWQRKESKGVKEKALLWLGHGTVTPLNWTRDKIPRRSTYSRWLQPKGEEKEGKKGKEGNLWITFYLQKETLCFHQLWKGSSCNFDWKTPKWVTLPYIARKKKIWCMTWDLEPFQNGTFCIIATATLRFLRWAGHMMPMTRQVQQFTRYHLNQSCFGNIIKPSGGATWRRKDTC